MVGNRKTLIISFIFILLVPALVSARTTESIDVQAAGAVIMDQKTGRIFYGKNEHKKMRIASITKIMTAIIAIESGKLDDLVTVSERAVKAEGSSIYLQRGEKIRLEDLVYGLMLRSGNDAAIAIAEHVGGSVDGFVYLMNEKAREIGMTNTYFSNPHGLDDHEEHYSTAYDMALLMRYAMENETFRKISGARLHRVPHPEGWMREWTNKHKLVRGLYPYANGGKTGYTRRANRTLVTTAEKDGMELIAVTLNSRSSTDWQDHIEMFEHVFTAYEYVTVVEAGTVEVVKNPVYRGKAYLKNSFIYPVTEDEKERFSIKYRMVKPEKSWKRNEKRIPEIIGKAEIYFGNELVHTMPVYYQRSEDPSFFKRFGKMFRDLIGVRDHD
ncbi:MAG: D-alanyl-D-alanine carboxypeptidase family protein [Caldibacillus sp.]